MVSVKVWTRYSSETSLANRNKTTTMPLREDLASLCHDLRCTVLMCLIDAVGDSDRVKHLRRLSTSKYGALGEQEKEQNRFWADKFLRLLSDYNMKAR
jgi:hypothetical protein